MAAGAGAGRMRAWRVHAYAGAADLRLEIARVPALRSPRDVLVRVLAAALNPLDVAMLGGYGARVLSGLRALEGGGDADVEFPLVPGREFVGRVERSGPAAWGRLEPGARVWGVLPPHRPGCHAQYVLARDCWVGPAPATLDDHAASGALYAGLTACAALRAGGLAPDGPAAGGPGARVLLLGLGGVGQAALQLLARRRLEVTVACCADQAALASRLGAAHVLDRHADDYDRKLDAGPPYTAIVDCAGLGGAEAHSRRWRFARYVTLSSPLLRAVDERGVAGGLVAAGAELLLQSARAAVRPGADAASAGLLPPHVRWAFFEPRARDIAFLHHLAERGQLSVSVERVYGWRRAAAAYRRAGAGSARGKLVLDFTRDDADPDTDTDTTHEHCHDIGGVRL